MLLIGCTRVNNKSEAPGQQVDQTLDMTTIHKFPLQMVVLLMFNTRDSLTYEEIKEVGTQCIFMVNIVSV